MGRPPQLRKTTCTHCGADIVWGTLQNGRHRSFDANPLPRDNVPPADAYAYSKRRGAMVCLDGEPHPPTQVLQAHYCQQYRDNKLMAGVDPLADIIPDVEDKL